MATVSSRYTSLYHLMRVLGLGLGGFTRLSTRVEEFSGKLRDLKGLSIQV